MKEKTRLTILLLLLFCALNGLVFRLAGAYQERILADHSRVALGGFARLLNTNLEDNRLALSRMANRWNVQGGTSEKTWRADAKAYAHDLNGAYGVGYADSNSVIQWLEPLRPNEAALHFNLSSESRRQRALELARSSRSTHITDPVDLVQGGKGFLMLCPVYRNDKLDGYIYLATRFEEYFSKILTTEKYCLRVEFENETLYQTCENEMWRAEDKFRVMGKRLVAIAPGWTMSLAPKPAALRAAKGTFLLEVMTISLLLTGALVLLMAALADIRSKSRTIRSQMRDLEAAKLNAEAGARAKEDFLATVSHEIRTPLNGIIGLSNLLKETPLNDQQAQFVNHLSESGSLLLALINDVLDMTKIEMGRLELENVNFHLEQAIDHVISSFVYQAGGKNIRLQAEFAEPIPHWVCGDVARLKQVLINLIGNALKFSHQGTIIVRTEILEVCSETITIRTHVIDQGVGIDPESRSRIFEKFRQGSKSIHRQFGGTGLGLSISKQIVEKMGGTIGVESKVGVGSDFFFVIRFPLGREELLSAELSASRTAPSGRKLKVLVAEDNIVNQMVALALLRKYGYECQAVGNGLEVLSILHRIDFDVILMDCMMPDMDGFEATREIRKMKDPVLSKIPIIAMTANAMSEDREKCLQAGMQDYVTKPVVIERLIEALNSVAGV